MKRKTDELRTEYPTDLIRSGVRGKFARKPKPHADAIVIDPDLSRRFPDSASVNRALRAYLAIAHKES